MFSGSELQLTHTDEPVESSSRTLVVTMSSESLLVGQVEDGEDCLAHMLTSYGGGGGSQELGSLKLHLGALADLGRLAVVVVSLAHLVSLGFGQSRCLGNLASLGE